MERLHAREPVHPATACANGPEVLPLGVPAIDRMLPGGGLAMHGLHEAASAGADTEHAAAATLFVAGLLARMEGPVLWVLRQADLFAPALAGAGLHPSRVIFAEAGKDVLAVMEEGLRHSGLSAVVGEQAGKISLTASRRLQLAAEQGGVMAILIRRSQIFDDPAHQQATAAFTRWRIAALPSSGSAKLERDRPDWKQSGRPSPSQRTQERIQPDDSQDEVALVRRPRWQIDLMRCRGSDTGSWIVEACDAKGRLGMAAGAAGRSDQAA